MTTNEIVKMILKYIKLYIFLAVLGVGLLYTAYLLPVGRVNHNLEESCYLFEMEGANPTIGTNNTIENSGERVYDVQLSRYILDNVTDMIMLKKAAYKDTKNMSEAVFNNPNYNCAGGNNDVEYFIGQFKGKDISGGRSTYSRYWHGYLVILKPLLIFMDYSGVRQLLGLTQKIMILLIILLLWKKGQGWYSVPVLLSYLFLSPRALSMSLQYNTMFAITYVQLIVILVLCNKYCNLDIWKYHFFVVGCLTSYFDFLTYPAVGFGIPFIFLIALFDIKEIKTTIKVMLVDGISWCLGYVSMWGTKWILASLFTDENVIVDAVNNVVLRSSGSTDGSSRLSMMWIAIRNNISEVEGCATAIIILIVLALASIIYTKKYLESMIYIGVAIIPFAWYAACSNHSILHSFFTFRTIAITFFSLALLVTKLVVNRSKKL